MAYEWDNWLIQYIDSEFFEFLTAPVCDQNNVLKNERKRNMICHILHTEIIGLIQNIRINAYIYNFEFVTRVKLDPKSKNNFSMLSTASNIYYYIWYDYIIYIAFSNAFNAIIQNLYYNYIRI